MHGCGTQCSNQRATLIGGRLRPSCFAVNRLRAGENGPAGSFIHRVGLLLQVFEFSIGFWPTNSRRRGGRGVAPERRSPGWLTVSSRAGYVRAMGRQPPRGASAPARVGRGGRRPAGPGGGLDVDAQPPAPYGRRGPGAARRPPAGARRPQRGRGHARHAARRPARLLRLPRRRDAAPSTRSRPRACSSSRPRPRCRSPCPPTRRSSPASSRPTTACATTAASSSRRRRRRSPSG